MVHLTYTSLNIETLIVNCGDWPDQTDSFYFAKNIYT